ncbi:XRE family transcriptional regulator [Siccibacter turicensis]|uniref:XRE family transcriptional regulator n=1 Tax=Siccibacter turicensis TaxID=357233 RepID=UPI003F5750D7
MKIENLADRLNYAMSQCGMTQGALAKASGVAQPTIWRLANGNARGSTKIVEIANALNVRVEWLSTGEGAMRNGDQDAEPVAQKQSANSYRVDVLDVQASAGPGTMLSNDFIETIRAIEYTPEKGRALFGSIPASSVKVITVRGDSMEGTIDPGDEIFVNVSIRGFDGDGIYVFVFGNTLHVKRLQMHKDKLLVLSDNDRYKEWYIEDGDMERFHIMAKVLIKQTIAYKRFG